MAAAKKAPWKKPNPKPADSRSHHLTPAQKSSARKAAKKAGRPYPNLIDNMSAARKSKNKSRKK
jgi:hypothetical protein